MAIKSYAKINLFLDVLSKRPDGYHDVASVMQSIDLCDDVTISVSPGSGIRITTNHAQLPCDETNLAHRAAKLLLGEFGACARVSIHIRKRIPMGAGLGGGSANCAAVLRGLHDLLGLAADARQLHDLAARLGADVPFCLRGGTAMAGGTGTQLESLPPHPDCCMVLVYPGIHISTAHSFGALDAAKFGAASADKLLEGLRHKNLQTVASNIYNVFQQQAAQNYAPVADALAQLGNCGAQAVCMSGTGSAVFGYFADCASAQAAAKRLRGPGWDVFLTKPVTYACVTGAL